MNEFGATFRAVELDQLGGFPSFLRVEWIGGSMDRWDMLANDVGKDDGAEVQSALQEITSQRTVPNIFVGQKHIGGNSDLQAKKGELPDLLKAAGAL